MSEVAKMLKGEIDVDDENITKPALVTQLLGLTSSSYEPHGSSSGWGTPDGSSPLQVTNVSHGTMTFSSIYDRSN